MTTASIAEIRTRLGAVIKSSKVEPVVITQNGKPVAIILGVQDTDEIERLRMAYSPKLQAILETSRKQIRQGDVLTHAQFWAEVEACRAAQQEAAQQGS